jgi:hypothetical protein
MRSWYFKIVGVEVIPIELLTIIRKLRKIIVGISESRRRCNSYKIVNNNKKIENNNDSKEKKK